MLVYGLVGGKITRNWETKLFTGKYLSTSFPLNQLGSWGLSNETKMKKSQLV